MDIVFRKSGRKWVTEVWDDPVEKMSGIDSTVPLLEDQYQEMNQWCIDTLGYHARTAYHVFELRKQSHLNWFIMRWK